jgi:nucleoside-diphosphate-sugar epimerase
MNEVCPRTVEELEEALSRPTDGLAEALAGSDGDLIVLGVGGKMGPTLARMARRAMPPRRAVIGVARFSEPGLRESLERAGVRTIAADLLDAAAVERLPDAPQVVFMAGMKFGSSGAPAMTWAMNTRVPALTAERYRGSRIVVFSSGNVYPFVPVGSGGATESTPPEPVGEYAQSVLGRERTFEYFSARDGTPALLFRLNYAVELRYGVLLDVAQKVWSNAPIDLTMGHANVLWQRDANAAALRCLELAASPPRILNVTGPETASIRALALRFGELMGRRPDFVGRESDRALLSNAAEAMRRFGPPTLALERLIEWVAEWVRRGGPTLGKPTHFETTDGKF